ncbi:hypothetical protein DD563_02785 [Pelagicola sp. LXJ1103]|nr:hypothetical protein DD563_02785 [Pelagicola sp. LXJ1103]
MNTERAYSIDEKGIWRLSEVDCAIGVVVFAYFDDRVVIVRKAPVDGYEFSGKWALPGGLIRGGDASNFQAALSASVRRRAQNEANIVLGDLEIIDGKWGRDYPVTRYTVRGVKKYTVVIPVLASLTGDQNPFARDHSISEAKWVNLSKMGNLEFAPANTIIADRLCERILEAKVTFRGLVDAERHCQANAWALNIVH